ncbi:MAG TPA: hypothetical protein VGE72_05735 [Azospirillum sp.]
MSIMDVVSATAPMEALSNELAATAEAIINELSSGPFLPIFERHEIERLVCSPMFRSFLESEHYARAQRLPRGTLSLA